VRRWCQNNLNRTRLKQIRAWLPNGKRERPSHKFSGEMGSPLTKLGSPSLLPQADSVFIKRRIMASSENANIYELSVKNFQIYNRISTIWSVIRNISTIDFVESSSFGFNCFQIKVNYLNHRFS
jgi:hypothetical protein